MPRLTESEIQQLCDAAQTAADNAYCPYSTFPVGAAVLTEDGEIFIGCNVENASYGLTLCAERAAVAAAVSAGRQKLRGVAVFTPTPEPTPPCGACRQVIAEFGPAIEVISACDGDSAILWRIEDLLVDAFGLTKPNA